MKNQTAMCARTIIGLLALMLTSQSAQAQSPLESKADEQTIRDLVRQENEGKRVIKFTDQSIIASGATPRPVVGQDARKKMIQELSAKRLNQTRKDETLRLVISESGDMAYEFGNFTLSFDTPEKKQVSFSGYYLRVWRKVNREWMVEVLFARPHETVADKRSNE